MNPRRAAVPALAGALVLLGATACTSDGYFAPATCVVDSVSVNGLPANSPRLGALVNFTSSGELRIHGRAGSQVDATVNYHRDGSGYRVTGFRGGFGYYDSYIPYDSALDDLLVNDRHVAVTREKGDLRMSVDHTVVRCYES